MIVSPDQMLAIQGGVILGDVLSRRVPVSAF
jgi:hypothetical protein